MSKITVKCPATFVEGNNHNRIWFINVAREVKFIINRYETPGKDKVTT